MPRVETGYDLEARIPPRHGLTPTGFALALAAGTALLATALVAGFDAARVPPAPDVAKLLVGTWQCHTAGPPPLPITFRADGTVARGSIALRYAVEGNRVAITAAGASNAILQDVESITGDHLVYSRPDTPERLTFDCDRRDPGQVAATTPAGPEHS